MRSQLFPTYNPNHEQINHGQVLGGAGSLSSPSLREQGFCRAPGKPAFEGPKRGLNVTDTPAGGQHRSALPPPSKIRFALATIDNGTRRWGTTNRFHQRGTGFHFLAPCVHYRAHVSPAPNTWMILLRIREIDRSWTRPIEFTDGARLEACSGDINPPGPVSYRHPGRGKCG